MAVDRQFAKLAARILENLPDVEKKTMQWWIDHPKELKSFLDGLNVIPKAT